MFHTLLLVDDIWFTVFQFLSLKELCNCCLISKEFYELMNQNVCWKFYYLQLSNNSLVVEKDNNIELHYGEDNNKNNNWKDLLRNYLSRNVICLSSDVAIHFMERNTFYINEFYQAKHLSDLQEQENNEYIINLKEVLTPYFVKYLKDSFILQTIKVLLHRIKILDYSLQSENNNNKLIETTILQLITDIDINQQSKRYELKLILEINGLQNKLVVRFQNFIYDTINYMYTDNYITNKCDYIIWINYNDFTTEELKLDFTKRDKSKGFWFIGKFNQITAIYDNLNILQLILQQIIPIRKSRNLTSEYFQPLFIFLLSKIEQIFIGEQRGTILDEHIVFNWPKKVKAEQLKNNNLYHKYLYHDNLLLNDILNECFMDKRKNIKKF
ncbi:hypothetical protein ABK040_015447 [Willaertia magna]